MSFWCDYIKKKLHCVQQALFICQEIIEYLRNTCIQKSSKWDFGAYQEAQVFGPFMQLWASQDSWENGSGGGGEVWCSEKLKAFTASECHLPGLISCSFLFKLNCSETFHSTDGVTCFGECTNWSLLNSLTIVTDWESIMLQCGWIKKFQSVWFNILLREWLGGSLTEITTWGCPYPPLVPWKITFLLKIWPKQSWATAELL